MCRLVPGCGRVDQEVCFSDLVFGMCILLCVHSSFSSFVCYFEEYWVVLTKSYWVDVLDKVRIYKLRPTKTSKAKQRKAKQRNQNNFSPSAHTKDVDITRSLFIYTLQFLRDQNDTSIRTMNRHPDFHTAQSQTSHNPIKMESYTLIF